MSWLIVGAGAQGRIDLDIVRACEPGAKVWFIDDAPRLQGGRVAGVEVLGRGELSRRPELAAARVIVAVGDNLTRLRLGDELRAAGLRLANLIHPSAVVMASATLGGGILLAPGAIVQSGARVGDHALVNTGAIVEHDCEIEPGASLSPGCRMAGRVRLGRAAFLGTGATVAPRVTIGAGSIIGAGAVVVKDIPPGMLAYGNPARVVRAVEERDWSRLL